MYFSSNDQELNLIFKREDRILNTVYNSGSKALSVNITNIGDILSGSMDSGSVYNEVLTYNDLAPSPSNYTINYVKTETGTIKDDDRKLRGLYQFHTVGGWKYSGILIEEAGNVKYTGSLSSIDNVGDAIELLTYSENINYLKETGSLTSNNVRNASDEETMILTFSADSGITSFVESVFATKKDKASGSGDTTDFIFNIGTRIEYQQVCMHLL